MVDVLHSGAWKTLASVTTYDQPRTMFQPVGGMDQIALAMARALGPAIRANLAPP